MIYMFGKVFVLKYKLFCIVSWINEKVLNGCVIWKEIII